MLEISFSCSSRGSRWLNVASALRDFTNCFMSVADEKNLSFKPHLDVARGACCKHFVAAKLCNLDSIRANSASRPENDNPFGAIIDFLRLQWYPSPTALAIQPKTSSLGSSAPTSTYHFPETHKQTDSNSRSLLQAQDSRILERKMIIHDKLCHQHQSSPNRQHAYIFLKGRVSRESKSRTTKHLIACLELRHAFADFDHDARCIASKNDGEGHHEHSGHLHEAFPTTISVQVI